MLGPLLDLPCNWPLGTEAGFTEFGSCGFMKHQGWLKPESGGPGGSTYPDEGPESGMPPSKSVFGSKACGVNVELSSKPESTVLPLQILISSHGVRACRQWSSPHRPAPGQERPVLKLPLCASGGLQPASSLISRH